MYNEKRKMNFIESYTSNTATKAFIKKLFASSNKYEAEWGSDICMQSAEKLRPVIYALMEERKTNKMLVLIVLRQYVKWCAERGFETSSGIFDVKFKPDERIKSRMVSSPLHLKLLLDKVYDDSSLETIHCVYRSFLWMAYAGIDVNDAAKVEVRNVDFDNMVIRFGHHEYEIYKESRLDFEMACNLSDFNYIHPNYETRRARALGNTVIRGYRDTDIYTDTYIDTIRELTARRFKSIGHNLSYSRLQLSGIFYRAYERERAGLPVNFSEVVARYMEGKDYKLSKNVTLNKIANKLERDYLIEYEYWKCTFI